MELHCAHRLGDEWVVMLVGASLNDGNAERGFIFFETRGQDTACEATAYDEVVGHINKLIETSRNQEK